MKYRYVVQTSAGGPDALQVVEAELPEPGPGQVSVAVQAAGVAFGDLLRGRGMIGRPKPPFTPGYDLVGTVVKQGPGVTAPVVGQPVAALTVTGGYTEAINLPATDLVPVPSGLDPAAAVSLVLNYVTAWQLLHRVARVQPGDRMLVHGAAGGVGTALLDLGRLAGLQMFGTASAAKHDRVAGYGATPIDYRREDFVARVHSLTGTGVDAVFDPIGGRHFWRSHRALRRGGRLVGYGVAAALKGDRPDWAAMALTVPFLYGLRLFSPRKSASFYSIRPGSAARADLATLAGLLASGQIRPLIARRMPLTAAAQAQELLRRAAVCGKIVLVCGAGDDETGGNSGPDGGAPCKR